MTDFKYGYPVKIFVRETHKDDLTVKNQETKYITSANPLSGESAREFYENIINEPPKQLPVVNQNVKSPKLNNKRKHDKPRTCIKNDLLKFSQNNEYKQLENLLKENGCEQINETDNYGWTALMCASCSGAREAVEILLKHKADPMICDKFGNNALSLAKRKRHLSVVKMLENGNTQNKIIMKKKNSKFFCETCDGTFTTESETHESSTLHQFNSHQGQSKTFYGIPDCNKGFQLLLKNGWNREKGLGPRECGMKFPIKVRKKNDRIGIGGVVCDTKPSDASDSSVHTKKKMKILNVREKNFERNFRLQFL